MANKASMKNPPLTTVFIVVIVAILALSLIFKSLTTSKPQTQMTAKPNPLPQQTLNQGGHKSTVLSFTPATSTSTPLAKKVGDIIPLELVIDPGQNLVSFVKVDIMYDPTKLAPVKTTAFQPDESMSSVLDGPLYTRGKISVTMSIGADPTRALAKPTNAATVTFKAIAPTTLGETTQITFGPTTNILSLASQDNASENVLSSTTPEVITIAQ